MVFLFSGTYRIHRDTNRTRRRLATSLQAQYKIIYKLYVMARTSSQMLLYIFINILNICCVCVCADRDAKKRKINIL